ncbi:MAG: general secretion pathway protein GspK [Oligoflexales bacterium]
MKVLEQFKHMINWLSELVYKLHTPKDLRCGSSNNTGYQDKEAKQRGISLLIAIMSIAVMITFVSEMIVSSTVNVELAIMTRDRIKTEYLGKSGINLGLYLLSASYLWDHVQASGALGVKQEPTDGPASLWTIFNQWPPLGAEVLNFVQPLLNSESDEDPFGLKGILNEKVAAQMKLFEDQFSVKISDESSKINISDCVGSADAARACPAVIAQLEALFACPAEKQFLESKNLSPRELAFRIRDYISSDEQVSEDSNLGSKDDPYQELNPPYKAKRLPFDSISELNMVKGWDDQIHAVFAPYLTIYPFKPKKNLQGGKKVSVAGININTASSELIACLIPQSRDEVCREKSVQKIHKFNGEGGNLASSNKEIKAKIEDLYCYSGDDEGHSIKKEEWFEVRSDVFNITVDALTGHQRKKISAIIRRIDNGVKGADVEKREVKRSYQILYWKIT